MSTKYTFSLKEGSEKEKKLKDLSSLFSNAKAKSRFKVVPSGTKGTYVVVPDDESVDEDDNIRSYQKQRIRAIKNSSFSPLRKIANLVKVMTSNHMDYLEKWPSFSSKLQNDFCFDSKTYSAIVDLILEMAEKDVDNGLERTVEQWYETVVFVLSKMKEETAKKTQMETEMNSMRKVIQDLNIKLDMAQKQEAQRARHIDRWYFSYEGSLANAESQRKKIGELVKESNNKDKLNNKKISQLQGDNSELQLSIAQLQHDKGQLEKEISQLRSQLEANSKIVSEAKKSIAANRTPISDEPLTVLADGVKEYVDEVGVDKAYDLFNRLNTILIGVPAWTKHGSALKKFFQKVRKEKENRSMVQGDYVVNKHVDKEVNGVSAGATGILINKDEG